MSIHATSRTPSVHFARRRATLVALAISLSTLACGSNPDAGNPEFRDGCDGAEEYIDENGEEVICVYTDDYGGGSNASDGGDPCWLYPWLCDPTYGDDGGEAGDGGDGGDGGDTGEPTCNASVVQSEAFFAPVGGKPGTPGLIALLSTYTSSGGTTPFDVWLAAQWAAVLQRFQGANCPPPGTLVLCTWQPDGTIRCRFTVMPSTPPECSETQPCPAANAQCIGGQCIVDLCAGVTCDGEHYCDPATGQCMPNAGCTSNVECPNGTVCEYTQCVPGCRFSFECGGDLVCLDGDCVEGCATPSDCAHGMHCDESTAQCQPGCQYDLNCADGSYCATPGYPTIGECQPGCWSLGDCGPGEFCDLAIHQCRAGCSIFSPCPSGSYCRSETGECIAGCQSSLDCDFGTTHCNTATGQCEPGCVSEQDCPYPQVCSAGTCVPGEPQTW